MTHRELLPHARRLNSTRYPDLRRADVFLLMAPDRSPLREGLIASLAPNSAETEDREQKANHPDTERVAGSAAVVAAGTYEGALCHISASEIQDFSSK